ncbi:MAG: SGNH/GDSL hydrolase family protein [Deltaproteobacteria bacterium]|nr:SGNH/GDSL hydrolase family protein [Deltaproteobacteria bacterium]
MTLPVWDDYALFINPPTDPGGAATPSFRLRVRTQRSLFRFAAFGGAVLAACVAAETAVRALDLDWRIIDRMLPYTDKELQTHEPVDDARLIYRLRPSSEADYTQDYGPFHVTINRLGWRDRERQVEKSPGVFRIACVGGSNVYGAGVNDSETWPAALERILARRAEATYEVWNLGVSGYNAAQMTVVGEQAIAEYHADLVLYSFSNTGPRFFLAGTPDIPSYFQRTQASGLKFFPRKFSGRPGFSLRRRAVGLFGTSACTATGWPAARRASRKITI